jgi:hypothetical protein
VIAMAARAAVTALLATIICGAIPIGEFGLGSNIGHDPFRWGAIDTPSQSGKVSVIRNRVPENIYVSKLDSDSGQNNALGSGIVRGRIKSVDQHIFDGCSVPWQFTHGGDCLSGFTNPWRIAATLSGLGSADVLERSAPHEAARWGLAIIFGDYSYSRKAFVREKIGAEFEGDGLNADVGSYLRLSDTPRFFDGILRRLDTLLHPSFLANNPIEFKTAEYGQGAAKNRQPKRVVGNPFIGVHTLGFLFGMFVGACYGLFLWWIARDKGASGRQK